MKRIIYSLITVLVVVTGLVFANRKINDEPFKKSNLKRSPKPEHCLVFKDKKNLEIRAFALWHMDKIEVFKLDLPFDSSCK